ncbi:hypothetical protein [Sodalis sp.]
MPTATGRHAGANGALLSAGAQSQLTTTAPLAPTGRFMVQVGAIGDA